MSTTPKQTTPPTSKQDDTTKIARVAVGGIQHNGTPGLWFLKVRANRDQIEHGRHYDAARSWCEENGIEYRIAYDDGDAGAAEAILDIPDSWDEPNETDDCFIPTVDALPV